jgi:uncharacterized damage-inducible protein DinB
MTIANELLAELDRESFATRRLLERVPTDKLEWRPHPKSMTLRDLAWHVATLPSRIARIVASGAYDLANARPTPAAAETTDFAAELHRSIGEAKEILGSLDDKTMLETFTLSRGDVVVFSMPRAAGVRTVMLNHTYHHRGQLTVYLRLLDVPLPATYGSSADEKPGG